MPCKKIRDKNRAPPPPPPPSPPLETEGIELACIVEVEAKKDDNVGGDTTKTTLLPPNPEKNRRPKPNLDGGTSEIMTDEDVAFLSQNLPMSVIAVQTGEEEEEARTWRLLYHRATDGRSFQWLQSAIVAEGPTLIVMETTTGHVFGGFSDTWVEIRETFYGRSSACAVFKLRPGQPAVFHPTFGNYNFQYCNRGTEREDGLFDGIGMGGQPGFFTWFISENMEDGICCGNPGSTFATPLLCGGDDVFATFRLKNLEVWCIDEPLQEDELVGQLKLKKSSAMTSILEVYKEMLGFIAGKDAFSDHLIPPIRERGR